MAIVKDHAPGTFCWMSLGTTDATAAKEFYRKLFGWETQDLPMGDNSLYTMLKQDGSDVGGLYELSAEMKAQGIPSHWLLYVAVSSADETAAKVAASGGTIQAGAFDVPNVGRMAVIKDPQGAALAAWQAKGHAGAGIVGEIGTVCWNELNTTDTAGAAAFYKGVFGWEAKTSPVEKTPYTEWQLGGKSLGGMMQIQPEWGPVPPHWLVYFRVGSCDESLAKAVALGAKALMPPMDIKEVGRFAIIQDPTGAVFAVIALNPAA
jgi:predicted enzyme related to lactoylglutathione lyase